MGRILSLRGVVRKGKREGGTPRRQMATASPSPQRRSSSENDLDLWDAAGRAGIVILGLLAYDFRSIWADSPAIKLLLLTNFQFSKNISRFRRYCPWQVKVSTLPLPELATSTPKSGSVEGQNQLGRSLNPATRVVKVAKTIFAEFWIYLFSNSVFMGKTRRKSFRVVSSGMRSHSSGAGSSCYV